MLDKITFAKRYSKALFQLLDSSHELKAGFHELIQIREILQQTPQFMTALNNVGFPEANKRKLVNLLIKNVSSKYIKNLIKIVYACGRMDNFIELINQFERLYDQKNKIVRAQLITAVPLNDQQKAQLKNALAQRTGANQIKFKSKVDRSIIGGVIIKSSGVIFDGSIKTKIDNMKQLLLN